MKILKHLDIHCWNSKLCKNINLRNSNDFLYRICIYQLLFPTLLIVFNRVLRYEMFEIPCWLFGNCIPGRIDFHARLAVFQPKYFQTLYFTIITYIVLKFKQFILKLGLITHSDRILHSLFINISSIHHSAYPTSFNDMYIQYKSITAAERSLGIRYKLYLTSCLE